GQLHDGLRGEVPDLLLRAVRRRHADLDRVQADQYARRCDRGDAPRLLPGAMRVERTSEHTPSRRDGDRGAALMEAMLVAPVLFAVLLGILEFGLIYRDALTTSSAVNDVARMGAVIGPRPVPF